MENLSRKRKMTKCESPTIKRFKMAAKPKKANINDMPNEVLLNIFLHLRRKDLLSATLVNKNWNDLISSTKTLVHRISKLFIDDRKLMNGLPNLTRRYESIQIEDVTEWNPKLFKSLNKIGSNIRKVELIDCVFFDDDFKSFIQCFENLKILEIWDCHPGISPQRMTREENKIILNKLEVLVVKEYSWPLKLIETPNLRDFLAESMGRYDQEWLIDFLNRQTELQCLHLINIFGLFDHRLGHLEPRFDNLKELVLYDLTMIDMNQFLRMLSRVKSSVISVDIGFDIRRDITEFILQYFDALIKLTVDYECLPTFNHFNHYVKPNETLKQVSIFGSMRTTRPLLNFLKNQPGIETLDMKMLSNLPATRFTFWSEFSKVTPSVRNLSICKLESCNMIYINNKKLSHLDVEFIGHTNKSAVEFFCKNNPNIEKFHIYKTHQYTDDQFEDTLKKQLKKLKDFSIKISN